MYNQSGLNHHMLWSLINDKLGNGFTLFSLSVFILTYPQSSDQFLVGKKRFSKKGESMNGAEDLHLTMAMEEVDLMKIT